jgi:hypothetical protein
VWFFNFLRTTSSDSLNIAESKKWQFRFFAENSKSKKGLFQVFQKP